MNLIDFDTGYDLILSKSECQEIIDWFKQNEKTLVATTRVEGTDYDINREYSEKGYSGNITETRKGFVSFTQKPFPYEQEIRESVYDYADKTGIRLFQDVPDDPQLRNAGWQFTQYIDKGDKFDEHQDQSVSHYFNKWFSEQEVAGVRHSYRKISATIQLSAPEDYIGAALKIRNKRDSVVQYPRERGSIICFPSYAYHAVDPLESGERYSLVGWFYGPFWR